MRKYVIRRLHVSDLLRRSLFALLNGTDWAITRGNIAHVSRWYLPLRDLLSKELFLHKRYVWVGLEGQTVWGMVSARMRSGPRVFEIDHFYLSPLAEDSGGDLMEMVGADLSREGVQKIFLRLLSKNSFVERIRLGGFLPSMSETLYYRSNNSVNMHKAQQNPLRRLRPFEPIDDLGCFQLYNASTPLNVRSSYALTREQWHDSSDPSVGSTSELVYESEKGIRGWLGTSIQSSQVYLDLLVHPDEGNGVFSLVQAMVEFAEIKSEQYCMVPSYALSLQAALENLGFSPREEFRILTKSMTVGVKISELASIPVG